MTSRASLKWIDHPSPLKSVTGDSNTAPAGIGRPMRLHRCNSASARLPPAESPASTMRCAGTSRRRCRRACSQSSSAAGAGMLGCEPVVRQQHRHAGALREVEAEVAIQRGQVDAEGAAVQVQDRALDARSRGPSQRPSACSERRSNGAGLRAPARPRWRSIIAARLRSSSIDGARRHIGLTSRRSSVVEQELRMAGSGSDALACDALGFALGARLPAELDGARSAEPAC